MSTDKAAEADKLVKKAKTLLGPSLLDLRFRPDWDAAVPMLEKAAMLYRQANQLDKARSALEKASTGQERLGSSFHAAKHLEACGEISKQLGQDVEMTDYYKQASTLFLESGKPTAAAESLLKGARSIEEKNPSSAIPLYKDALELYENDSKDHMASDAYRQAISCAIKAQNWPEAVQLQVRFGVSCDKANARASQCKAYLGAAVTWLYAGQAKEAWRIYQDTLGVDAFATSDEAFAAEALFEAYKDEDPDKVKKVVKEKTCFKFLDNQVGRLAVKLPTGNMRNMAAELEGLMKSVNMNYDDLVNEGEDPLL